MSRSSRVAQQAVGLHGSDLGNGRWPAVACGSGCAAEHETVQREDRDGTGDGDRGAPLLARVTTWPPHRLACRVVQAPAARASCAAAGSRSRDWRKILCWENKTGVCMKFGSAEHCIPRHIVRNPVILHPVITWCADPHSGRQRTAFRSIHSPHSVLLKLLHDSAEHLGRVLLDAYGEQQASSVWVAFVDELHERPRVCLQRIIITSAK